MLSDRSRLGKDLPYKGKRYINVFHTYPKISFLLLGCS